REDPQEHHGDDHLDERRAPVVTQGLGAASTGARTAPLSGARGAQALHEVLRSWWSVRWCTDGAEDVGPPPHRVMRDAWRSVVVVVVAGDAGGLLEAVGRRVGEGLRPTGVVHRDGPVVRTSDRVGAEGDVR